MLALLGGLRHGMLPGSAVLGGRKRPDTSSDNARAILRPFLPTFILRIQGPCRRGGVADR
jgi:hypothetical protein